MSGQAGLIPWALTFLPHLFLSVPGDFHYELAELITHDRVVVAAPRGHAKSTLFSLADTLFQAAVNKAPYQLIVSDTTTQADSHLGNIYQELLENDLLVRTYPHLALPNVSDYQKKRVKRTVRDIITLGGLRISGAGAGQSLRGLRHGANRPSHIKCDDIENDESVRTEEQRDKLWDWFTKSLMNLFGAEGGSLVVLGTILHKKSLLSRLLDPNLSAGRWERKLYRAIQDDKPLWPEHWTLERLEAKRLEIGSRAFSTEYLNQPIDDESTLWKMGMIDPYRVSVAPVYSRRLISVDPSTQGDGDACGIIDLGKSGGKYYVEGDYTVQGTPAVWARVTIDTYRRVGADAIVYEQNQGGLMVVETLKAALRPGEAVPRMIPVNASRGKTLRAEPIVALYEAGSVHHIGRLEKLEEELTEWIPGMDSPNRLDALVHGLTELSQGWKAPTPEQQRAARY